jgi:hypothetical protein
LFTIKLLDSIERTDHNNELSVLKSFLKRCYKKKNKIEPRVFVNFPEVPQQNDNNSCGIFTLIFEFLLCLRLQKMKVKFFFLLFFFLFFNLGISGIS